MELVKRARGHYFEIIIIIILLFMTGAALFIANYAPVMRLAEVDSTDLAVEDETSGLENADLILEKYAGLDMVEDVKIVEDIEASTPLDLEAAYAVVYYSKKFEIQPSLLLAMIEAESNFDRYCVGTHEDRGYLQIIPPTEKWLAETYSEELKIEYNPERIFEPDYNIGLGAAYISLLKNAYGNDLNRILSEYNRGPYNLKKFYEENNTYETAYSRSILSREKKYEKFNR